MFDSKAVAYQVEDLSGAPLFYERLLTIPTNIRLDWNDLPGTNNRAYSAHL